MLPGVVQVGRVAGAPAILHADYKLYCASERDAHRPAAASAARSCDVMFCRPRHLTDWIKLPRVRAMLRDNVSVCLSHVLPPLAGR